MLHIHTMMIFLTHYLPYIMALYIHIMHTTQCVKCHLSISLLVITPVSSRLLMQLVLMLQQLKILYWEIKRCVINYFLRKILM